MLHHHMPHHGIILQRIAAWNLAIAGLLQAAVGHDIHHLAMRVNASAAIARAAVLMVRLMSRVQTEEARP